MSTGIQIDHSAKIIQQTVSGELHTERSLRLVREVAMTASLNRGYSVLMDLRDTTTGPAMLDLMAIASACAQLSHGFGSKIAFLIPDTPERLRFAQLFKSCMESKGFEFRQFFDHAAAMAWLTG
jgi:hypothetical protein